MYRHKPISFMAQLLMRNRQLFCQGPNDQAMKHAPQSFTTPVQEGIENLKSLKVENLKPSYVGESAL